MRNEIPLICYLKLHETNKNQFTNFTQKPNKAKTLQMTMNLYLMGKSFVTLNKPLMVFTGTNESSVEYYLNAVTANLILSIGPEPINKPLHQKCVYRSTALLQTRRCSSTVQLKNGFLYYTKKLNPVGNALHVSFQNCLTLKEINNIKVFYLLNIADSKNPK